MDPTTMEHRLSALLSSKLGGGRVSIMDLRRMTGGASRETWSLDLIYESDGSEHRLPLVLRRDPPGAAVDSHRRDEFALLQAAAAAGVPVPAVHWLVDDTETLGAPFFLMDRIEGETLPRRLLRDAAYAQARQIMTAQLGSILARIHRIDTGGEALRFLVRPEPAQTAAELELERYEQVYRFITPDPHPALELALHWLRQQRPPAAPHGLVHGDFRIGNVIYGPEGVRSILDWELAHVGDPMEDLGWMCVRSWRFGSDDQPAGGIGSREDLFAAYEAAGGVRVDPQRVHYWEVLGNLKWAIMTIMQAKTHLDGNVHSVELASLGRRTAEMELELLHLINATS